jgi:hypothetical protein
MTLQFGTVLPGYFGSNTEFGCYSISDNSMCSLGVAVPGYSAMFYDNSLHVIVHLAQCVETLDFAKSECQRHYDARVAQASECKTL